MTIVATQTDLRGLKWQDAYDEQRAAVGDDDTVLLHHFGNDGMIDGHIFIGENYAEETECEVGAHPRQNVPVVLSELGMMLVRLKLPPDGWS